MLKDLLKSNMYDYLNSDIRQGLFCSFIAFILDDNVVNETYLYYSKEVLKAIGRYFNINFTDVELELYINYDFSAEEYINILEKCNILEHKDLDNLIAFLRVECTKLDMDYGDIDF